MRGMNASDEITDSYAQLNFNFNRYVEKWNKPSFTPLF